MTRGRTGAAARICPVCGTPDARPIVYGLPTRDLADDPSIVLGGCMVTDDDPAFRCRNPSCAEAFGLRRR
jgi:hypothetical protein